MKGILIAVLAFEMILPEVVLPDDQYELPPKKSRGRDLTRYIGSANSVYAPPPNAPGRVPCGPMDVDVIYWPSPLNNKILEEGEDGTLKFMYTSCFNFLRDPDRQAPLVTIRNYPGKKWSTVTIFIVRETPDMLDALLAQAENASRTDLDMATSLIPMPLLFLDVSAELDWIFPVDFYKNFPSESDANSTLFTSASVQPVEFTVPEEYAQDIADVIADGVELNISYGRPTQNVSESIFGMDQELRIDSSFEQDLFGDRGQIWATREQVMGLMYEISRQNRAVINASDKTMLDIFMKLAQNLMNQQEMHSKELGQVRQNEMTDFLLRKDDPFTLPNETHMTHDKYVEATKRLNSTQSLYEKTKKNSGGGGFSFLGFGANGRGSSFSRETNQNMTLSEYVHNIATDNRWEGREIHALKQKIYQVSRSTLKETVRTAIKVSVLGAKGFHVTGTSRNTYYNIVEYDRSRVRRLLSRYSSKALPTRGSLGIID